MRADFRVPLVQYSSTRYSCEFEMQTGCVHSSHRSPKLVISMTSGMSRPLQGIEHQVED